MMALEEDCEHVEVLEGIRDLGSIAGGSGNHNAFEDEDDDQEFSGSDDDDEDDDDDFSPRRAKRPRTGRRGTGRPVRRAGPGMDAHGASFVANERSEQGATHLGEEGDPMEQESGAPLEGNTQREYMETGQCSLRSQDEDACAVCFHPDFSDANQVVYCDGCNVRFHQLCYNVPTIPEGLWFCDYCSVACEYAPVDRPSSCCSLCWKEGGGLIEAMSLDGKPPATPFVHKICAVAFNEVRFVAGTNLQVAIPPRLRMEQPAVCRYCTAPGGMTMKCSDHTCTFRFHVHCCINEGGTLGVNLTRGRRLSLYCAEHKASHVSAVVVAKGSPYGPGDYRDDKLRMYRRAQASAGTRLALVRLADGRMVAMTSERLADLDGVCQEDADVALDFMAAGPPVADPRVNEQSTDRLGEDSGNL